MRTFPISALWTSVFGLSERILFESLRAKKTNYSVACVIEKLRNPEELIEKSSRIVTREKDRERELETVMFH